MRRSVGLPDRDGLLVREVEDDSPAASAGILRGDLIVSVAGTPVVDPDELLDAIGAAKRPFEIRVVRGADELSVTVGTPNSTEQQGQLAPDSGPNRGSLRR